LRYTGTVALALAGLTWTLAIARPGLAQHPAGHDGSGNVSVIAHIPLGGLFTVGDIEIEQELSRPYAYVARMHPGGGLTIIDLRRPPDARILYSWEIDDPALHQGLGGMQNKYFKSHGRYYDVQSFQFNQTGPSSDLGAIVFDVTGLPDTSRVKEVG